MELSSLFGNKAPLINPESATKYTPKRYATQPRALQEPAQFEQQSVAARSGLRSALPSISISSQARKIITNDSMQEEVAWFDTQNLLECLTKITVAGLALLLLYHRNWTNFNMAISAFVFVFLVIGLHHCIFGTGIGKVWVSASLVGTTLVLVNQIFLHLITKLNESAGAYLFQTHYSLIPSLYITTLLTIVLRSYSLLSRPVPTNLLQNVSQYPGNLVEMMKIGYKLRYALLQVYSILLVGTFFTSLLAIYNGNSYEIEQLFTHLLHPTVLCAQAATLCLFVLVLDLAMRMIDGIVGRLAHLFLYNHKNKDTKLPMILELLRVSTDDVFGAYANPALYNKHSFLDTLGKLLKMDFSMRTKERKLTRREFENIYVHSLTWLKGLVSVNPNVLSTKISTSKFHHSYFGILKQFAQKELGKCSNNLYELHQGIANLTAMRTRSKGFRQDLFYWFRVVKSQFSIWAKAEECCRHLKIADLIMEIFTEADLDAQLWLQSPIGYSLKEVRQHAHNLQTNPRLNQVIRQKMQEYYHKTNRILRDQ